MRPAALAALAAVAAGLSLAACSAESIPGVGSDDSDTRDGRAAKAVVERFAESSGPEACEMFTPAGLRKVYGADEPPGPAPELTEPLPAISLAECRRRSVDFSGEKIEIEKVDIVGETDSAARVEATTGGEERTFTITLRRKGSAWLIDEIREK